MRLSPLVYSAVFIDLPDESVSFAAQFFDEVGIDIVTAVGIDNEFTVRKRSRSSEHELGRADRIVDTA